MLTIRVFRPGEIGASSLRQFVGLVRSHVPLIGSENGTYKLATRAKAIVGLYSGYALVGGIGVKVPRNSWKAKLERKSGVTLPGLELGWLFVKSGHENLGGGRQLVEAAVCAANGASIYATVQTDHAKRQTLLREFGFAVKGGSFRGECGSTLSVFVKNGNGQPCGQGAASGCSSATALDAV